MRRVTEETESLFDDPFADARMRRLIPRFAVLGGLAYVLASAVSSNSPAEWAAFGALLLATLGLTAVISRTNVLAKASRRTVFVLLVLYAAVIAVPVSESPAGGILDEILEVLVVFFGAVFFAGAARWAAPVAVALAQFAVVSLAGQGSWANLFVHLVGYLLVAYFGSEVAATLRESLRSNRAVHTVLESATSNLGDADLATVGLDDALAVCGWDASGVLLVDGDELWVAAVAGLPEDVTAPYSAQAFRVDGPGVSSAVVRSGETQYVGDAGALLGDEEALVKWGAQCLAGVPIRYRGEILGSLSLYDRTRRSFNEAERFRVGQVAEQLALALAHARSYRQEADVATRLLELNRRKDEFLANVSHELRTPATSLGLAARTLHAGRGRLTEEQEERIIEMMRRRSSELTGLIEGLLAETVAASGQTRLELQPIDWCEALPRWVRASEDITGRTVQTEVPEGPLLTFSDPAKCERIVGALLSNAAKFSDPDSPITCRLVGQPDMVEVTVVDRGIGIPQDVLPKVFDRFFQGDGSMTRAYGGLGIGLSLVRHFAEVHGGRVDIASTVGVGTTVTVALPRDVVTPRLSIVPPLGA